MALNPDCQEKVYQQIKEAVEENDGDPDLDYAAYQKMEYLEQCITEANRIYPISKFLFSMMYYKKNKPWTMPHVGAPYN